MQCRLGEQILASHFSAAGCGRALLRALAVELVDHRQEFLIDVSETEQSLFRAEDFALHCALFHHRDPLTKAIRIATPLIHLHGLERKTST